jgi:hypothetical protein
MKAHPGGATPRAHSALARLLPGAAALLVLARPVRAHEGPPFAIVMDHPVDGWSLSVWTDPDIGIGTFFLLLDPPEDDEDAARPVERAALWVRPSDGSVPERRFETELEDRSEGYRFYGEVEFPVGGFYAVRFELEGPAGRFELVETVEATPPGLGRIDLLWYLAPFAAVGFLWIRAMLAKRRLAAQDGPTRSAGTRSLPPGGGT